MDLEVATLAERPELGPLLDDFPGAWPQFMYQDILAALYYDVAAEHYPEHMLVVVDRARPERAVARACTVPFRWTRPELPAGGWDEVIRRAALDRLRGRRPNAVSALEITIQTDLRGRGLAAVVLDAMRANARALGFDALVAPVRPNGKADHPDVPMADYVRRTRADGLPQDAWLRVHARAGGEIVAVAPRSMTITGTLAEWREWTGLPFDTTGPVAVPGALVPVHCDVEHDHGVYVEPNVWVRHRT